MVPALSAWSEIPGRVRVSSLLPLCTLLVVLGHLKSPATSESRTGYVLLALAGEDRTIFIASLDVHVCCVTGRQQRDVLKPLSASF